MRAPDVLQSGVELPICRCCGTPFARRRGGNKFCVNGCNWCLDENARQALRRLSKHLEFSKPSLGKMIAMVSQPAAQSWSSSPATVSLWEDLNGMDQTLTTSGPNRTVLRRGVKRRAESIRINLETKGSLNSEELRRYVHALEVLRDAGAETPDELAELRGYAWAAVRYYESIGDFLGLARAIHHFSNTCRLLGDAGTARQMLRYAFHILNEKRSLPSAKRRVLLHHATYWDLRSCVEQRTDLKTMDRRHNQLLYLAGEIDTPVVWMQTWQELAGYWGMRSEKRKAEQAVRQLDAVMKSIDLPTFGKPNLLRAKIELYLDIDRDRAIHLIENDYLAAYRNDPRKHYSGNLERWRSELNLAFPIPPATYESPILFYVPRGDL
jgi:hypothetical protein